MNFDTGSILLIKDYKLPTTIKDKFFIVIGAESNEASLLSMTTTQVYFNTSLLKHGIIQDRNLSIYCFQKDKVIGENGFSFRKNTFVSHYSNIHRFENQKLSTLNVEYMDCLTKNEVLELVYSFYKYKGTKNKHKKLFEKIISDLTKQN